MTLPGDLPSAGRAQLTPSAPDGFVAVCAQIAPRLGDVSANLETHLGILEDASRGGAHLVVFPEMSLCGYFLRDLVPDVAVVLDGPELATLAAACTEVDAVVGCVLETGDARFLNAAVHLSRGRVAALHAKVFLPTYGLFDEQRYLAAGERLRTLELTPPAAGLARPWQAGMLICEDIWHLGAIALLARQGMEVLIVPSASPGRGVRDGAGLGTARSYDAMTRTYAQLTTAYVVYCNRVGFEDGVGFWGGSRVLGPDGETLHEPAGSDEALVWNRLERGAVRRARLATPLLRDARPDLLDRETARLRHGERHRH
ncbi:MAG TPA: nitrilase-related carbon-nitrogen hydrolase [Candidatus Dormibacteraeota bacterium]